MKSRCNRNVHMLRPAAESKKLHNMSCFRVLFSSGTESMRVGGMQTDWFKAEEMSESACFSPISHL